MLATACSTLPIGSIVNDPEPADAQLQVTECRKDVRSQSVVGKRAESEARKYYFFKYVKRGDLGQRYFQVHSSRFHGFTEESWLQLPCDAFGDVEEIVCTKKKMFEIAKLYPRPPVYHHSHAWDKYFPRYCEWRAFRKLVKRELREISWVNERQMQGHEEDCAWGNMRPCCEFCVKEIYAPGAWHFKEDQQNYEEHGRKSAADLVDLALYRWKKKQCLDMVSGSWIDPYVIRTSSPVLSWTILDGDSEDNYSEDDWTILSS